jgi:hypothetical protein
MATFLHKPTGIEASTKCMCLFAFRDSMTVMSNKTENKPYRLKTQEKKKHLTLTDWLKKYNKYCINLTLLMLLSRCVTKFQFYLLTGSPTPHISLFHLTVLNLNYMSTFDTSISKAS